MILGAHVSIAGGISKSVERAFEIGCETFQIFTKNQMQWKIPVLKDSEIKKFKENVAKLGVSPATVHSSYLVNIASPDKKTRLRSLNDLIADINRADKLGIPYLVFHPGAHKGKGVRYALDTIAEGLNEVLFKTDNTKVTVLMETTAGEGTNVGYKFEHLSYIMNRVEIRNRIGVCIDTCHIFAAGYDIRSKHTYRKTMNFLDTVIGLENIKAFHLNDSKRELGSRMDRHEEIGKGKIGIKAFELLVNDHNFENVPGILETPGGIDGYKRNISILKSLRREK